MKVHKYSRSEWPTDCHPNSAAPLSFTAHPAEVLPDLSTANNFALLVSLPLISGGFISQILLLEIKSTVGHDLTARSHRSPEQHMCVIEPNSFPFNADFNRLTHIWKPSSEQPYFSLWLGCKASKMLWSAELLVFVAGLVWQNVFSQAVVFSHDQDLGFMINCWNVTLQGFHPFDSNWRAAVLHVLEV